MTADLEVALRADLDAALVGRTLTDPAYERARHLVRHGTVDELQPLLPKILDPLYDASKLLVNGSTPIRSPDAEPASLVDRLRARILTVDQVEQLPPPEYLIEGYVVANTIGCIYGRPGTLKSFAALDWCASIATGSWWFKREVKKGSALFIAAEGLAGMGTRIRAWKEDRRVYTVNGMHFIAGAVNMLSLPDTISLCQVAAELQPSFIVVDTLARSIPGGDENGRDMGVFVEAISRLQEATGAAVWAVHHGTKADGSLRGHTSLEGACDTVVEAKATDGRLVLTVDKQKDDAKAPPMFLYLKPVLDSCVLTDRRPADADDEITDQARVVLEVLVDAALDDGISTTNWFTMAVDQGVSKSAFYKHRKTLVSTDLVHNIATEERPRYVPADKATEGDQ